jgi:3-methylcrotonyl-CoA carboxylase alpha subunit
MLIKAAAGGGGKAMRVVMNDTELESAIMTTASEAENYFSDSTIYVERFFINPRHIEVQILGDKHGNIIHLFERECSMQRRHQKIIEEAPSVTLTPAIREKICSAAVQMAGSINYHSAGTIEFLVDNELNFYFLEMNTRIQVEHPVTETITGIDIVKEQFLIAEGNPLSIKQEDVSIKGHAIETRIYAENPASNFMPSPGKIQYYSYPQNPCIRIEEPKFHHDSEVFSNFDPMISKVIALGENRESAIKELTEYLPHYAILGINTNIPFLISLLNNKDYQQNRIHTRYIDDRLTEINANALILKDSLDKEIPLISAMIYSLNYTNKNHQAKRNIWEQIGYWRLYRQINLTLDEVHYNLVLNSLKVSTVSYNWNGKESYASLRKSDDGSFVLELNDKQHIIYLSGNSQNIIVQYSGFIFTVKRLDISVDDSNTFSAVQSYNPDSGDIIAPMPGRVLKINVNAGDRVTKGSLLMVVEAMKMENNILSPFDGVIDRIMVKQGDNIDPSSHLVHLAKIEDEVSGS